MEVAYVGSSGILTMGNEIDYVLVKGDFITQSSYSTGTRLSAGVMELKGNFEQKINGEYDNFAPTGTHKVVVSGETGVQEIKFSKWSSYINILDIRVPSERLSFSDSINVNYIISNGNELPGLIVDSIKWTLNEDEIVNGNLYALIQ